MSRDEVEGAHRPWWTHITLVVHLARNRTLSATVTEDDLAAGITLRRQA